MADFTFVRKLVEKEEPSLRYRGEDPVLWQKMAREKLIELLGMDRIVPVKDDAFLIEWKKERETYVEIRFSFESEEGQIIPCHILLPKGKEKPVPVICVQGHSKGMYISLGEERYPGDHDKIVLGDRDFAIRAVKEGCAAVTIEQRYMGERGGDEKGPGCINYNLSLPSLLVGRTAIGERVWDISKLIDVLYNHFADRLELDKLVCLGNSGGGTTLFYAACVDERIKTAVPSCSVCTFKDSIAASRHCGCNFIPGIAKYFDMGDLGGLIAPRNLLIVAGENDDLFRLEGVKESYLLTRSVYDAMGCRQNCELIIGNGGHRFYADDAWKSLKTRIS